MNRQSAPAAFVVVISLIAFATSLPLADRNNRISADPKEARARNEPASPVQPELQPPAPALQGEEDGSPSGSHSGPPALPATMNPAVGGPEEEEGPAGVSTPALPAGPSSAAPESEESEEETVSEEEGSEEETESEEEEASEEGSGEESEEEEEGTESASEEQNKEETNQEESDSDESFEYNSLDGGDDSDSDES